MAELWVDRQGKLTRAAIIAAGQLVALEVDHADHALQAGAIVAGKVLQISAQLGAARIGLSDGSEAYLDLKGPHKLKTGMTRLFEWRAPARGTKQAAVRLTDVEAARPGPSAVQRALAYGPVKRVVVAEAAFAKELPKAEVYKDKLPLFEVSDVEGQIAALLQREVALAAGGALVFDETEALMVVDVNGGAEGNAGAVNRAAVVELARQLRLRNIGGPVVVDMVGNRHRAAEALRLFKPLVAGDGVDVFGLTKLGLLELVRERRGYPLKDLL